MRARHWQRAVFSTISVIAITILALLSSGAIETSASNPSNEFDGSEAPQILEKLSWTIDDWWIVGVTQYAMQRHDPSWSQEIEWYFEVTGIEMIDSQECYAVSVRKHPIKGTTPLYTEIYFSLESGSLKKTVWYPNWRGEKRAITTTFQDQSPIVTNNMLLLADFPNFPLDWR